VLLPPTSDGAWAKAAAAAVWRHHRFTVGGSADDAAIGDLDFRRVVAVNPSGWGDDLRAFFDVHYPGVIYVPVEASSSHVLKAALEVLTLPALPPPQPEPPRGLPREQYARSYVLLPPDAGEDWALSAMEGSWGLGRFTVGGSADDAGVGDLDVRRVIAINPSSWSDDLAVFFAQHYPGVRYTPISAGNVYQLRGRLAALCLRDRNVSLSYPTTRTSSLTTDDFGVDRETYFHNGLDLASSWDQAGDELRSATEGTVVVAGWNPSEPWFGYQVRVRHTLADGRDMLVRYAHLKGPEEDGIYVWSGQQVQRGQRLGRPDTTGVTASGQPSSTGDHLHLDVKVDGQYVDPAMLIDWPE
jgi:murein DD-endopeptidase MepM/ murein hydrolase activator NlpD